MNCSCVKLLRRTMRILSLIIVCSSRRNGQLCRTWSFSYRLDQIPEWRVHSCRLPPPSLEPGRRGPERFWALRRYEQIIDRVDERCQIDGRGRGADLAVGDRGFVDEGRAGIFQVRLDAPPAGGALAASQSGIRKDPWAVADRGNDPTRRRRLLNEPNGLGIVAQRIGIPNATRN